MKPLIESIEYLLEITKADHERFKETVKNQDKYVKSDDNIPYAHAIKGPHAIYNPDTGEHSIYYPDIKKHIDKQINNNPTAHKILKFVHANPLTKTLKKMDISSDYYNSGGKLDGKNGEFTKLHELGHVNQNHSKKFIDILSNSTSLQDTIEKVKKRNKMTLKSEAEADRLAATHMANQKGLTGKDHHDFVSNMTKDHLRKSNYAKNHYNAFIDGGLGLKKLRYQVGRAIYKGKQSKYQPVRYIAKTSQSVLKKLSK